MMINNNLPRLRCEIGQALTAEQMREVDRVAVEEYGISERQLMEVAAFQMGRLVHLIEVLLSGKKVLVLAGSGNNGADVIATARYLMNYGAQVRMVGPDKLSEAGKLHLMTAKRMGISYYSDIDVFYHPEIVIDGIIGYSLKGPVRNSYVKWIEYVNHCGARVYAMDIPSGLSADGGGVSNIAVRANYTLTLAYPKKGLFIGKCDRYVGELFCTDIGIPRNVFDKVLTKYSGLEYINLFEKGSLVKVVRSEVGGKNSL